MSWIVETSYGLPVGCVSCPFMNLVGAFFTDDNYIECRLKHEYADDARTRPTWCPLKEVKKDD